MEECTDFWAAAAELGMPISIYRPLDGTREPEPGIVAGVTPEFYNDLTTIIYANIPDNNPGIRFISLAPTRAGRRRPSNSWPIPTCARPRCGRSAWRTRT